MLSSTTTRSFLKPQLAKSISACASSSSSSSSSSHSNSASSIASSNPISRPFSSSTYKSSPSPSPSRSYRDDSSTVPSPQLTPRASSNPESLANYFQSSLHPQINLPNRVALQAITHESWEMGTSLEGNNRRLSFIGRRALKFYLTLFLSSISSSSPATSSLISSSSSPSDQDIEAIEVLLSDQTRFDKLLHTTDVLGDTVGRAWELEKVMRWRAALGEGRAGGKETGLYKIRGVCLEGVVGAVYHQQGALAASNLFYANILPHLLRTSFPRSLSSSEFIQKEVERRRKEGEKGLDSLNSNESLRSSLGSDAIQQAETREVQREVIKRDASMHYQTEANNILMSETESNSSNPTVTRTSRQSSPQRSSSPSPTSSSIPPHNASDARSVDSASI